MSLVRDRERGGSTCGDLRYGVAAFAHHCTLPWSDVPRRSAGGKLHPSTSVTGGELGCSAVPAGGKDGAVGKGALGKA